MFVAAQTEVELPLAKKRQPQHRFKVGPGGFIVVGLGWVMAWMSLGLGFRVGLEWVLVSGCYDVMTA